MKKYTYWKVFHCISKPILGIDPCIKQFGGSCPYYCPVIRNIYKVQASMSPGFRQGKMKLPLVYVSSIVPALVFFSTLIANCLEAFCLVGLVWFDWQELLSSHFLPHDPVSTSNPSLFASSTTEDLALLSQVCSPPIFWRVYIPWYTFGFFYKILFLILPTHFSLRLFDALKKVGSENKL